MSVIKRIPHKVASEKGSKTNPKIKAQSVSSLVVSIFCLLTKKKTIYNSVQQVAFIIF